MRLFNFLLASDAIGGLGPPEDLVNKPDATGIIVIIWIFVITFTVLVLGSLIYFKIKTDKENNDPKGDE